MTARRPRLRPRSRFNPLHLAGWLFADMLLVLALVAMGDQGDPVRAAQAAPHTKPGATPTAKPKPKGPRAVVRTAKELSLDADAGDTAQIVRQLRTKTAPWQGRKAAFVLTFGRSPDVGGGVEYARRINSLLTKARPDMFTGATTRDFFVQGSSGGHADIEIYFYTY
ncbi:hypothetical protein LG634_15900 [Streptomyces bambusae]|uniref:hypothetical protein n=1 Tax=Streptomyces bambusae TaxID=1550616 RepID=UPI001CFCE85F|nr:hypothetical protein [Streptomyces bambusae]MCB5166313.1 hypothetical protein [Streptomyces bambusae]